jgi:hypothetical protein
MTVEKPNLIYTEIVINAPISRVTKEFYDFDSYPLWNPYITFISTENSQLALVKLKKKSLVTVSRNSDTEFGWIETKSLVQLHHNFYFEKIDEHSTKFIQEEYFTGVCRRVFSRISSLKITNGFIAMNEALKARCESTITSVGN